MCVRLPACLYCSSAILFVRLPACSVRSSACPFACLPACLYFSTSCLPISLSVLELSACLRVRSVHRCVPRPSPYLAAGGGSGATVRCGSLLLSSCHSVFTFRLDGWWVGCMAGPSDLLDSLVGFVSPSVVYFVFFLCFIFTPAFRHSVFTFTLGGWWVGGWMTRPGALYSSVGFFFSFYRFFFFLFFYIYCCMVSVGFSSSTVPSLCLYFYILCMVGGRRARALSRVVCFFLLSVFYLFFFLCSIFSSGVVSVWLAPSVVPSFCLYFYILCMMVGGWREGACSI